MKKLILVIALLLQGCAGMTIPADFEEQNNRNDRTLQDMQRNDRHDMAI